MRSFLCATSEGEVLRACRQPVHNQWRTDAGMEMILPIICMMYDTVSGKRLSRMFVQAGAGSDTHERSFVPYCRGAQQDARALRAKALAEDLKAPLGLLMPMRNMRLRPPVHVVHRCVLRTGCSNIVSD